MSENLEKKKQIVASVVEKLKDSGDKPETTSTVVFNYSKIEVNELNNLRAKLEETGTHIKIIKNTLIKRVLDKIGSPLETELKGQNAILIPTNKDLVSSLKELYKFINENEKGEIIAGILNSNQISKEEIEQLSTLPTRKELLEQIVRGFSFPMRGFAYTLNGVQNKFVRTLQAVKDTKE